MDGSYREEEGGSPGLGWDPPPSALPVLPRYERRLFSEVTWKLNYKLTSAQRSMACEYRGIMQRHFALNVASTPFGVMVGQCHGNCTMPSVCVVFLTLALSRCAFEGHARIRRGIIFWREILLNLMKVRVFDTISFVHALGTKGQTKGDMTKTVNKHVKCRQHFSPEKNAPS